MTQWRIRIIVSKNTPSEVEEEFENLTLYFSWEDIEILMMKGLRHIPTIVYTASGIPISRMYWTPTLLNTRLSSQYLQEVDKIFELLKQKVKVWIVRRSGEPDFVRWPCEVLDLKEVQDEVNWLATYNLMSKDNQEDREIAKIIVSGLHWNTELTLEEKIDDVIGDENDIGKDIANYFSRITEIHKKYPKARFWFYATSE
ncbi:MAG: hypothetical protein QW304_03210 [Thermoproteota archaeon]